MRCVYSEFGSLDAHAEGLEIWEASPVSLRGGLIRVVSARDMNRRERRLYEEL